MAEHIAAEDRLLEVIDETERIARSAGHADAPATGEHWNWVHGYADCPAVDLPVDLDACKDYAGENVEYGHQVDLRSVEEYQTTGSYTLPRFVVSYAEEVPAGSARHIARHDPAVRHSGVRVRHRGPGVGTVRSFTISTDLKGDW